MPWCVSFGCNNKIKIKEEKKFIRKKKMLTNHKSVTSFNQYKCTKTESVTEKSFNSLSFSWINQNFAGQLNNLPSNNITTEQKCLF